MERIEIDLKRHFMVIDGNTIDILRFDATQEGALREWVHKVVRHENKLLKLRTG